MKTLRLMIIATILTFSLVSVAKMSDTKYKTSKKVVHMTLEKAVQIHWLDLILRELDSDFLSTNEPTYTIEIQHNNYIVLVSGSYNQWAWFFRPNGVNIDNPPNLKQIRWR